MEKRERGKEQVREAESCSTPLWCVTAASKRPHGAGRGPRLSSRWLAASQSGHEAASYPLPQAGKAAFLSHLLAILSILLGREASTLLVVGLKKSFLRTIRIGKEDYLVSPKGREEGKRENPQRKREILGESKRDKALLRINTPRGKRSGQKKNACRQWGERGVRRSNNWRPWDGENKPFNCWEKRRDFKSLEAERIFTPGAVGNEDWLRNTA